jgi:hypothetical protein
MDKEIMDKLVKKWKPLLVGMMNNDAKNLAKMLENQENHIKGGIIYKIMEINFGDGIKGVVFYKYKNNTLIEQHTLEKNVNYKEEGYVTLYKGDDVEMVRNIWDDFVENGFEHASYLSDEK